MHLTKFIRSSKAPSGKMNFSCLLMNFVNVPFSVRTNIARVPLRLFVALGMAMMSSAQQQPSIPLEMQNSGKILTIRADSQEKGKDIYRLRGHVEVTYQEMKLTADEVTYDESAGELVGTGHVLFIDPRSHIAADEVHYNIRTQKGWFSNGHGFVHTNAHPPPKVLYTENFFYNQGKTNEKVLYTENPFYIQGEKIERLDENTYDVIHGRLTNCECENKGWSVSAGYAKVEVDDKVMARGSVIRFLGVPCFYLPYAITSIARKPRHTGFLLPNIGTSSIKGTIVGAGFFWAISPSMDLLLGLEDYSLRGLARRGQFRAKPSDNTKLRVDYFGVNDKDKVLAKSRPRPEPQGGRGRYGSSIRISRRRGRGLRFVAGFPRNLFANFHRSCQFRGPPNRFRNQGFRRLQLQHLRIPIRGLPLRTTGARERCYHPGNAPILVFWNG